MFGSDINYKLDIRDWKEKSRTGEPAEATRKLAERINDTCRNFTFMHYNQLIVNKQQYKDLAKFWGVVEQENVKGVLYRTDKGYVMEVIVKKDSES